MVKSAEATKKQLGIEQVVWPAIDQLIPIRALPYSQGVFSLIQIIYDGRSYYRFAPDDVAVLPHSQTLKFARSKHIPLEQEFMVEGHLYALDLFVMDAAYEFDIKKLQSVSGCYASYTAPESSKRKQGVELMFSGQSNIFGPPADPELLMKDLDITRPKYLRLNFDHLLENAYRSPGKHPAS